MRVFRCISALNEGDGRLTLYVPLSPRLITRARIENKTKTGAKDPNAILRDVVSGELSPDSFLQELGVHD